MIGSPGWTRTNDQRINSPTLYRLSYQGTESLARARILEARPSYVKQTLRISDLAPKTGAEICRVQAESHVRVAPI